MRFILVAAKAGVAQLGPCQIRGRFPPNYGCASFSVPAKYAIRLIISLPFHPRLLSLARWL